MSGDPDEAMRRARDAQDLLVRAKAVFAEYERHLKQAEAYHVRGDLVSAAVYAGIAAHMAQQPHAGFFVSPRLERLLTDIGRRTRDPFQYRRGRDPARPIKSVLHVCTAISAVGGHTKMLCNWIRADSKRTHSLAVTQHRGPILEKVKSTIKCAGGRIYRLNRHVGGVIGWAQELRLIAREYDLVVLHIYGHDVVPSIAFAEPNERPPVLLLNHGDHLFWLGASISDLVINLRDAAQALSISRRAIAEERNIVVPTIVEPTVREHKREEAKRALNLDPDTILVFSAARAMKYRTLNGVSYADTHVSLLKRHPHAVLWVLGVGDPNDWRDASAAVGGRINPLAETPNTRLFFEAADIYVNSFPFVSSTSMMEAAGYGVPLVSRFYGPPQARIFAINHPGLLAATLHSANHVEYIGHLSRLITDAALRERAGKEAREAVTRFHTPPDWLTFLEAAYQRAMELAPLDNTTMFKDDNETFSFGEPDCRHYEVFGFGNESQHMLKAYLGQLPIQRRVALWRELRQGGAFTSVAEGARFLLPEWLVRVLKD